MKLKAKIIKLLKYKVYKHLIFPYFTDFPRNDCDFIKTIVCESSDFRWRKCDGLVEKSDTIVNAQMAQQLSRTTCKQGSNWNFARDSIWVHKGCQARFHLCVKKPLQKGVYIFLNDMAFNKFTFFKMLIAYYKPTCKLL